MNSKGKRVDRMKVKFRFIFFLAFLFCLSTIYGQDHSRWRTNEDTFAIKYDLSHLFLTDTVYGNNGVFGDDYGRLQIVFTSVRKDTLNPLKYHVTGASRHMKNVTPFKGIIELVIIYEYPGNYDTYREDADEIEAKIHPGEAIRVYTITNGNFEFCEDKTKKFSGVFSGNFMLKFHRIKDDVLVNDLQEWENIRYSNNAFKGTWRSYNSTKTFAVAWGEGRIPLKEGVDIGEKEFEIAAKYKRNGWQKNTAGEFIDNPEYWWK
jgi:hypothetical protein